MQSFEEPIHLNTHRVGCDIMARILSLSVSSESKSTEKVFTA